MPRIIRIENLFGTGLYARDSRLGVEIDASNGEPCDIISGALLVGWRYMGVDDLVLTHNPHRPIPSDDGFAVHHNKSRWFYGFKNMKQLLDWFEGKVSPKDLLDLGMVIRILDVAKVEYGYKQVRYRKGSVKKSFRLVSPEMLKLYNELK